MIAWVSSCLLASGVSTMFNESTRMLWMIWGCFGLASAVGLDVAARFRERIRTEGLNRIATSRFDHDMKVESEEKQTHAAIREVVVRLLRHSATGQSGASLRAEVRHSCELEAEILLRRDGEQAATTPGNLRLAAKVTNLSTLGFELTLADRLSPQRITIIISAFDSDPVTMNGEVLWCSPQSEGVHLAGGRFLNVASVDEKKSPALAEL
jgi:hypothetical protein